MDIQTLKKMWKDSSLAPQKRFGQNFLFSEHWLQKMLLDLDFKRFETVTEIGPGVGALTLALIQAGAQQITVYEIDPRMVAFLHACRNKWNWPISIREQDAMTLTGMCESLNPHLLIGNLPYNISVPFMMKALSHASPMTEMRFMVQKEVADRLVAAPNTKDYGRVSVMMQAFADVKKLYLVPPGAFTPAPAVESAVVAIYPKTCPVPWETLDRVTRLAFQQRRKQLRHNFSSLGSVVESLAQEMGFSLKNRAEDLSVQQFVQLTTHL